MATTIAVGDVLSNRCWLELNEQAAVNTFNYQCIAITGAGPTDVQLAQFFDLNLAPFYKPLVPATVTYRGVQTYFLKRAGGGPLPNPVSSISNSGVGTASGNPLPRNTAPIMKYSTLVRGPGGRGRIFLPYVAAVFVANNGRPTVAFDVIVNGQASSLLSPFTIGSGGNTGQMVWVLVRKHKGLPPTVTGEILSAESADKFGQMHKRGDYGRANASPI